jgi:ubiquitin-protein ligase
MKRITRIDMQCAAKRNLHEQGIFIDFNEENVTEALAMIIGPKDSVYRDGVLYFKIKFPSNYPYSPPKVEYVSRGSIRIHPNLYTGGAKDNYMGKVCISILGTWQGPQWTSIMDIGSVLLSIQSLLDNNPLDNEPGFAGKVTSTGEPTPQHQVYKKCVILERFRTLICKNIGDIPYGFDCFRDVIQEHYTANREELETELDALIQSTKRIQHYTLSIYRINTPVDYSHLKGLLQDITF